MPLHQRNSDSQPSACPLTECMSLIGGVWTPNVLWCLSSGSCRFGELRTAIPLISAKVLSSRLNELEEQGVIMRRLSATSLRATYELTDLGRALLPAINAIVEVGKTLTTWPTVPGRLAGQ